MQNQAKKNSYLTKTAQQFHFQTASRPRFGGNFRSTLAKLLVAVLGETWQQKWFSHRFSCTYPSFFWGKLHMHVHGVVQNKQTAEQFGGNHAFSSLAKLKTAEQFGEKTNALKEQNCTVWGKLLKNEQFGGTNRKMVSRIYGKTAKTAEQFGQTAEQFGGNCWAVWWQNCWAVWGKLLSSLAKLLSSLGETAEQFGKTAEQFGGNCWAVWWNCWAVWGKLLSSLVKLLAKLLMILVKFVFFVALRKFIFDTKNHMVIKRNMVQSCSLWSPFRKIFHLKAFWKTNI